MAARSPLLKHVAFGAGALLASATASQASLIFYEGFDYASPGTLSGGDGGTGFSGNWTSNTWSVTTPGYTDSKLPSTVGNRISDSTTGSFSAGRAFDTSTLTQAGDVQWFSVLLNTSSASTGSNADVRFFTNSTSANSGSGIGFQLTGTTGAITSRFDAGGAGSGGTTLNAARDTTHLLIGRITWNSNTISGTTGTASATLSLWLNPTDVSSVAALGTANSTATGNIAGGNLTTRPLGSNLLVFGGTTWQGSFDEIRFGTDFTDVVAAIPEPSSAAVVAGLASLALVYRRRRKQL